MDRDLDKNFLKFTAVNCVTIYKNDDSKRMMAAFFFPIQNFINACPLTMVAGRLLSISDSFSSRGPLL